MKYGRVSVVTALSAIAFAGADPALAQGIKNISSKRSPAYMRIFGNAPPPYGFVRFCAYEALRQLTGSDFWADWLYGDAGERGAAAQQWFRCCSRIGK